MFNNKILVRSVVKCMRDCNEFHPLYEGRALLP